jgi:hypothetical protein
LGRKGAPDRWFFAPGGRLLIVEFKAPGGGVLSFHQNKAIRWLRAFGFEVHVIDDIDEGMALFDAA